jgi:hypothetical protein
MQPFQDRKLVLQGWRPTSFRLIAMLRRYLAQRSRARVGTLCRAKLAIATLATLLPARDFQRQWLGMVLANVCIVGGVVGAPAVSLMGWIGMALPARTSLHAASPILFTASLLWLCLAIVVAHTESAHR